MNKIFYIAIIALVFPIISFASDLNQDIESLSVSEAVPMNSGGRSTFYTEYERSPILKNRVLVAVGGGSFLSGNGFVNTKTFGGQGTVFLNNRLGIQAGYYTVGNKFNDSAQRLQTISNLLPDVDYAKSRIEISGIFNALYGKFRLTKSGAMIFDQFFELGLASHQLRSGNRIGPVIGAGLAFWWQRVNVRVGLKDYYYKEQGLQTSGTYNNINLYSMVGFLF